MTTPDALHREAHLSRLDELIHEVGQSIDQNCAPLLEHLKAARESLFGAMALEYEVNLETAAAAADRLVQAGLRERAQKTIAALLAEVPSPK